MKAFAVLAASVLVAIGIGVGVLAATGHQSVAAGHQRVQSVTNFGEVCGETALGGGAPSAVGVRFPTLLHLCPSGKGPVSTLFRLLANDGKTYLVYSYSDDRWSARLPVGTYRPVDRPGCSGPGPPFVVTVNKVLTGVTIWWGCDYR